MNSLFCTLSNPSVAAPLDAKFLRDYAETRGFRLGRPTAALPTPDGQRVLFLRSGPRDARQSLFEFDVATGATRPLLTPEQVLAGTEEQLPAEEKARRERMRVSVAGFTSFLMTKDATRLLVALSGRLYLVDRASGAIEALRTGPGVVDPKFAPDGRSVAYVRDHDVWLYDIARQRERALTRGGTELQPNGLAEFVAQEEMFRFSGYWWSPDSKAIVHQATDHNGVEIWHLTDPAKPELPPTASYYPRPGRSNATVRLAITRLSGGKPIWIRWDNARFPYLTRVDWHERGGLTLCVQTRDQRELQVLKADPATGATTVLLTETDGVWLNLDQSVPQWLENGSGFLWTSEREGAWQLELRDAQGALARVLTPPALGFRGLIHVDNSARQAFLNASSDPTQNHVYRVALDGGKPQPLFTDPGLHSLTFGEGSGVAVLNSVNPDSMRRAFVVRPDGGPLGELPSVAEEPGFRPRTELVQTSGEPGLHAQITRPQDLKAGQKYPVLVSVYGGPHALVVQASRAGWLLDQWLADQGFIVVAIDGRGTPGRGRAWEREIAGKFGSVPLEDQVRGLQALGQAYPELDLKRVGITGWSFGGYMSALAVLRRPDVFYAAVAGAPVTDWFDYDTHYTERYLGLPGANPEAYNEGSLLTYAENLQRPLLLMHGTSDDNVFFRHSLKLAAALFRGGKRFELVPLSGLTHMVPDPLITERRWSLVADFFRRHLTVSTSP
jgi:dipeptidyl-peptidase-4